jgi:hypothetical protein
LAEVTVVTANSQNPSQSLIYPSCRDQLEIQESAVTTVTTTASTAPETTAADDEKYVAAMREALKKGYTGHDADQYAKRIMAGEIA